MIDVVLTTAAGYPTQNQGGGTRVIFDILRHISYEQFRCTFVSTALQKQYTSPPDETSFPREISLKSKLGSAAYRKMTMYQNIVTSDLYLSWYLKNLKRRLRNRGQAFHSDIVHSHEPLSLSVFSDLSSAKKILTIHSKGGMVHERAGQKSELAKRSNTMGALMSAEQKAVQSADVITFPSLSAKELFFKNNPYEIPPEKVRVIYNGVDIDQISRKQVASNIKAVYGIVQDYDMLILNVAEHVKQKNISVLLKAIAVLKKEYGKNPLMVNIGTKGSNTDALLKEAGNLGIEKNVNFLGNVPNADVISFMKISDCFVLTSYNVIFDMVVLEALASGCAVIVSDDGGNREVIHHDHNGYLIPFNDENEIAKILAQSDFQRVKSNARQSIEQFSIKTTVKHYEKLYEEIMNFKSPKL